MKNPSKDSPYITHRVNAYALELLEAHPEGIRFTDLKKMIHEQEEGLHPKTVNGCVWKLVDNFPELVHKPEKGLFQLRKDRRNKSNKVEII